MNTHALIRFRPSAVLFAALPAMLLSAHAQDRTLLFNTSDTGVSKAISTWGLDTAWLSEENVRRGTIFMGQPQLDVIRFSFTGDWPLVSNDLGPSALAEFNQRLTIVNTYADSHTALYFNNDTGTYDPSFIGTDGRVEPVAWSRLINATRQRCINAGRAVLSIAPYNEPDNSTEQGSVSRLGDVCWQLRNSFGTSFNGIRLCGASTLNNDNAASWYNTLNGWGYLEEGNTHQLAGSFDTYAAFQQTIQANGDVGANDELHNVMEAMVGVEYGMDTGIWWGTAERARGEFVKASDGQRLAYAEHRPNWTAASVYRGPNGKLQAFGGGSERQAATTGYRLFSKDRDVFYDGEGPQRSYMLTVEGGTGYWVNQPNYERVVNISWGADVQPAINGRYILVNRNSGKALEVPGASSADGVQLAQNNYTGAANQQWDVNPLPARTGGDVSYFSVKAAHSGVTADVQGGNYNDGATIQQWNGGTNVFEQWILEYAGNGYFKVRTRWCNKCMAVNGGSTTAGALIVQWTDNGALDQQWRLVPATAGSYDFTAPAAPTGVTAVANAVSVRLNWNANAESDLQGYNVLRSTVSGGPYDLIARGATATTFTDKSANQVGTYYYVVEAADRSLNRSAYSAQVSSGPTGAAATVAQYAFDGNATDSTVNANHAVVVGSPTYVAGKTGSALDLNGTSQYAMAPAGVLAGISNFTVATWVNWDGGAQWQRIFDFGNGTSEYLFLTPNSGSGTLRFAITTSGGGGEQILQTTALPVGTWQHVAITRSGTTAKLFVNGVVAASGSITISPSSFNPALNHLGKSQYDGDPLFDGRLDDFVIYNYALSDAQVATLANALPSPWVTADIGAVGATGSASYSGGTFTVTGSGADIWNAVDEFRYVYQTSSGNCEMRARVATVQNTDAWAKSGVMIRESTAAGSRWAAVFITPTSGVTFQWRATTGGACQYVQVTGVTAPRYVRIVRSSNSFTAYYSSNGTSWTQIGTSQTIAMATSATIGLAVTSHNDGVLCTSTLDNVTATP